MPLRRRIVSVESQRLARGGSDARLEKRAPPPAAPAESRDIHRRPSGEPFRWDDGNPTRLEIAQKGLVRVPLNDAGRIVKRNGDVLGPGHERVALLLVIPRGPNQDEVEAGPIDAGIIPDALPRLDAPSRERLVKDAI